MRKYITEGVGLPAWSSPISHAVVVDDTCYVSGQLAVDGSGRYVPGSMTEEARLAFSNLFSALAASGFQRDDLVFVDVTLLDMAEMGELNALYQELFAEGRRPARTVAQVAALPFGGKVKVYGVAIRDRSTTGRESA